MVIILSILHPPVSASFDPQGHCPRQSPAAALFRNYTVTGTVSWKIAIASRLFPVLLNELGFSCTADLGASTWRKMPVVLVECSLVLHTYASVLSHTEYH